ncbi:DUF6452 family protein [Chryseobacterium gossypii]|uniref:DUF6452 family protein n=1 Tax=Chryseobacterium gossypii TaxID=3231602 RepID=UPI0035231164
MKYFKFILFSCFLAMLCSCGGDDDICESGEGTPRMKIRFKNLSDLKLKRLDSLYIYVDYGSGKVDLGARAAVDSILIPLRVDDAPYTDIYVKTRSEQAESQVRVSYSTKATYVSPGCGLKKTYENLSSELTVSNIVKNLEPGQNFIENEDKTNLYLLF